MAHSGPIYWNQGHLITRREFEQAAELRRYFGWYSGLLFWLNKNFETDWCHRED